jgi:Animal haem peroxidase
MLGAMFEPARVTKPPDGVPNSPAEDSAEAERDGHRVSRKRFLGAVGAGAGAIALDPARAIATRSDADRTRGRQAVRSDRFGRMFRLPPFAEQNRRVEAALRELGEPGGLLDANDPLSAGPKALIVDLSLSSNNPNNPSQPAGATFFGQFLDHDMTFDADSKLGRATAPQSARNFRTPALDLDSVYGAGPVADQHLYQPDDRAKLAVESGGLFEDLPRRADGAAIIADPRNDEHLIISGLHCAFLSFHNRAVDHVRAQRRRPADVFAEARRLTTWHYQWLIVHEFLPLIVGRRMVRDVLGRGPRFFRPRRGAASMPVEFQAAAYRMGHSMVRPSYRANLAGDNGQPFFAFVFDPAQHGRPDPDDLRGGCRAPRRFVGWQTFFDFGDGEVKPNKKIDTKISTTLFNLPLGAIASHDPPTSLPQRNLLRHLTWQLPSGQRIAHAMGVRPLAPSQLRELAPLGVGFERSTPLWYYVLKEAELLADGLHLGPVGGRIVAEVFLGLLQTDPGSYLSARPRWRPTLPRKDRSFGMTDFLTFAGVDPRSRGQ